MIKDNNLYENNILPKIGYNKEKANPVYDFSKIDKLYMEIK